MENKNPLPRIKIKITEKCNLSCSYCPQAAKKVLKSKIKEKQIDDIDALGKCFSILPGKWHVSLTGGESFLHPNLKDIILSAISAGHLIQIGTNLSASLQSFEEIARISNNKIDSIRASFHQEYFSCKQFLEKLKNVADIFGPSTNVGARMVVQPNFNYDISQIEQEFITHNLEIKFLPQRYNGYVLPFNGKEIAAIEKSSLHNPVHSESFFGHKCTAGRTYLRVHVDGNVYPCYEFKRAGFDPLCNILKQDLQLLEHPVTCPTSRYCCAGAKRMQMLV